MNSRNRGRFGRRLALLTAIVLTGIGLGILVTAAASAQTNPPERAVRQIKVMEGIIDQVLADSPNFQVFGHENVHGVYLNEFGAVFTFEASLTDQSDGFSALRNFKFDLPIRIKSGSHGESTVIEVPQGESDDSTSDGNDTLSGPTPPIPPISPSVTDDKIRPKATIVRSNRDMERAQQRLAEAQARMAGRAGHHAEKEADPAALYHKGKTELVQTLLDYGDTITSLRDDQWIALAAFLKDSDYFVNNRISRLVLKAKAKDLRDYAAGRITETAMRGRIVEEEY